MTKRNPVRAALLAAGMVLAMAPAAGAATVAVQGRTAVFTAAPGEVNQLTVELITPTYRGATFFDPGAIIKAGPGCVAVRHYAICGAAKTANNRVASAKVLAGDRNDAITVTAGSVEIHAGDGNDRVELAEASSSSSLEGGPGEDELRGGPGYDHLYGGGGDDRLFGGSGFDYFDGGPGADTISGGDSTYIGDAVSYEIRTAAVDVTLDGVANDGEPGEHDNVLQDIEGIIGGAGSDRLVGDPTDVAEPWANFYSLVGWGGDDVLIGGSASETIAGFDGNDTLTGNGGDDRMAGHSGSDTLYARDGAHDGEVECSDGSDFAQIDVGLDFPHDCETLLP